MLHWYQIENISVSTLPENKLTEITVGEKNIGLVKKGEQIFAFSATCPHASAKLCEGWIDAQGRIVCPLHHYRFDPANGRNTSGEGYKLRTYAVEIRGDFIYIGFIN